MHASKQIKLYFWLLTLGLIGFGIYFSGLEIPYYADDFQFLSVSPPSTVFYHFFHVDSAIGRYRPLEVSFLTIIQTHFGLQTLPIHLTAISIHILLSWLVYLSMIKLKYSNTQAILGSIFMLVSQANVHAVLSNDTLSQIWGTFFGCSSLLLLTVSLDKHSESDIDPLHGFNHYKFYLYYSLSLLAFILSLLSKESSISFFPLLLGIILVNKLQSRQRISIARVVVHASLYVIVTGLYLTIWLLEVPKQVGFGAERYDLNIGINVVKNLSMMLFAALTPVSSVTTFLAFKTGEVVIFSIIVVLSIVFGGLVLHGLRSSQRHATASLLGIFVILSLFPMALMNRVSELYVYNSMPFISALVGTGLGTLVQATRGSSIRHNLVMSMISLLFMSHVIAVNNKASLMKTNGESASNLLTQIRPYTYKLPKSGELLLLNSPNDQLEYSVFLMTGFNVLDGGLNKIKQLWGKDDLTIRIIGNSELEQARFGYDRLILSVNEGKVQVYQEQRSRLEKETMISKQF